MSDWIGWHFLPRDRRLGHGDGREVRVGETLTVPGPVRLCAPGTLHASRRILDALHYASGPVCCRVRLGADVIEDDDKAGSTSRTCLAMVDATQILQEFACDVAEAALHAGMAEGREPDPRSWAAVETKRRWLRGEVPDEEMMAAREAAWDAARAATTVAARDAAEAAAEAARAAEATATAAEFDEAVSRSSSDDTYWAMARVPISPPWAAAWDAVWAATYAIRRVRRDVVWNRFEADLEARVMRAAEALR